MVHELEYWYAKEPAFRQMQIGPRREQVFPCEIYFEKRMTKGGKGGRRE